ncbi:4-hydroxyphenylpyruvate dioxygenase [Paraferrimonas haliotis]|uniref:4-hydroxyphenylpyruvate dioxygenase n=1 Tax=Paraferrimonas haliotis TaxID=2013866 RepID=A0AA37WXB6_9GAMM|nr:4-hydroxyphenylpyruvate dioxygenase [Paraferrimonas haliotis]GLS84393.1 4-hydroxyphenylpyruvate dioxygenase [Paraferrimonas haliotis]
MADAQNPVGLLGIEFTEFASPDSDFMHQTFIDFGFSMTHKAKGSDIFYYNQNDIHFLLNRKHDGFGLQFAKDHGPSICSMGWRVENAEFAFNEAVRRGAKAADPTQTDLPYPAIYGIGDSLIYFIEPSTQMLKNEFDALAEPLLVQEKGFMEVDHLTNNVYKGTMAHWADFYKNIFGFTEVRYFDINGAKTGLQSYALRSPDGSFCIPINEGKDDDKNQIDEYLQEYKGPGVQHLAFRSRDILDSLDAMEGTAIKTLDIIDSYYEEVFDRVPGITEDPKRIKHHQVLVDGDDSGYLLQIFTRNLFGPIFIEIIQRKNNLGFGEGNFQALFESIELDQQRRGVL